MFDMHCVIFAGGKSSRMRTDKSLLPFGDYNTLVEYQYERMKKIFKYVSISTKSSEKVPFTCNIIEDPKGIDTFAPTAGFVALFNRLSAEKVFVLSVDTPFVGINEITQLINCDAPDFDAIIAKTAQGMHPMCGIYHRSLHSKFTCMLQEDNHRLGKLLKESKTYFVNFENEKAFANLNYPHEYEEALNALP
ncbi:MAG: molybdenum cofactor guanylyltransferase MobA [Campylobacterota bacterium]|nr:molybdenum cofactor guanylyltransferase MobA [Campylobacterota bacterium]